MKVWKGIKDVALVWNDKCLRDEYHVLFECKKNKSIVDNREKHLPKYFVNDHHC